MGRSPGYGAWNQFIIRAVFLSENFKLARGLYFNLEPQSTDADLYVPWGERTSSFGAKTHRNVSVFLGDEIYFL